MTAGDPQAVSSDHSLKALRDTLRFVENGPGCQYPVAVLHSPAGEARAVMDFPYDELQLENRLQALQIAILRSGGGLTLWQIAPPASRRNPP